ncbi:MAG: transposase [Muribaculaceae bacterium]|nr:transposase [Muribaculaceae bacterium]
MTLHSPPSRESVLLPLRPRNFKERTLKAHWSGIITNFTCPGVNNGILEGINQKIQLAKRRARGFALLSNFIDMAYFVSGKLKFDYPYNSL